MRKSKNAKRSVVMLATAAILLIGCKDGEKGLSEAGENDIKNNYQIYCVDADGNQLSKWGIDINDELTLEDKVETIVNAFMDEPENDKMKSAMPRKLKDLHCTVESNVVNVNLDTSYKALYSLEQLFFKSALVLSLTQIEGVDYVYITVNGQPLTDANGVSTRYFTKDSFIMYDNTIETVTSDLYTTLYYVNDAGDKLIAKSETYSYDRSLSPEMYVMELLRITAINSEEINETIPKEQVVNNAYTKNGICYVDFNENINDKGFVGLQAEAMLYAVVNSLMELQNVTGVKITICGKDDVLFRGVIAIDGVFHMNLNIVE